MFGACDDAIKPTEVMIDPDNKTFVNPHFSTGQLVKMARKNYTQQQINKASICCNIRSQD